MYEKRTTKEDRGIALIHIHKHDVSLNSEHIADDFAGSGSRRMELLIGWPTVALSQMANKKGAILTLSSNDLTLLKRRQFYEPF